MGAASLTPKVPLVACRLPLRGQKAKGQEPRSRALRRRGKTPGIENDKLPSAKHVYNFGQLCKVLEVAKNVKRHLKIKKIIEFNSFEKKVYKKRLIKMKTYFQKPQLMGIQRNFYPALGSGIRKVLSENGLRVYGKYSHGFPKNVCPRFLQLNSLTRCQSSFTHLSGPLVSCASAFASFTFGVSTPGGVPLRGSLPDRVAVSGQATGGVLRSAKSGSRSEPKEEEGTNDTMDVPLNSKLSTLRQLDKVSSQKDSFSDTKTKIVSTEYSLETFQRSNQDTSLTHKPAVFEGEWVQSGDLLSDCASSVGGELSLGQNLLIAYMPWEGYNFEDAILISERLVRDDLYTSVHIERYDIETSDTKSGTEQITRDIPDVSENEIKQLDSFGIVKMGSWVEEGDILVGKVTPINKKTISPYQKLLYTILEKQIRPIRDSSLRAPKGIKAKVIDIKYFLRQNASFHSQKQGLSAPLRGSPKEVATNPLKSLVRNNKLGPQSGETYTHTNQLNKRKHETKNSFKQINKLFFKKITQKHKLNLLRFYLVHYLELKPGLGLTNSKTRVLNKSRQLKSFDIKRLDSLSQISEKHSKSVLKENKQQKNQILQNIETIHIYLAEKRKIQVGDKMAGRHGNKGIISQILPITDMPYLPDGTPLDMVLNPLGVPSRMNVGQIYECLLGLAGRFLGENYKVFSFDEIYGPDASRSFVFHKLYQARLQTGFKWLFDPNSPGKIRLYDGRTGDTFDQKVTVGQAYMLRLVHMVDDKIHMRSTGPYSLVTQQPLRGRSKQGGQRLGEMEVWAIEGYGAAFTLLEMLTIKSDDMTGRMTLWSNLILNKDISIGTPESFKVLICELQALCLDIGLFRYMNTSHSTIPSLKEIPSLVNLP